MEWDNSKRKVRHIEWDRGSMLQTFLICLAFYLTQSSMEKWCIFINSKGNKSLLKLLWYEISCSPCLIFVEILAVNIYYTPKPYYNLLLCCWWIKLLISLLQESIRNYYLLVNRLSSTQSNSTDTFAPGFCLLENLLLDGYRHYQL